MITRFLKQLTSSDKQPSSLGSMLLVLSIVQILITGGTVAFVAFRNSESATNQLKNQLRGELAKQVENELTRYFAIPHKINTLNAAAYRRGEIDVLGASTGEAQLYEQLKLFSTISFAFCGTEQGGEFFGVLRDSSQSEESFQVSFSSPATDMLRHYYQVDEQGNRGDFIRIRESLTFNSKDRLWYQAAEAAQGSAWTDVYFGFTSDLPNITASTPIYDEQGKLEAVCATDVILPQEFRLFLRNLDAGGNLDFSDRGRAFVIDRNGKLIADSTDGSLTIVEDEKQRSRFGIESDDPLIQQTSQTLLDTFKNLDQIQDPKPLTVLWENKRYLVEVLPFQDEAGLDWLIVVVVPEDGFMRNIIANINRNTQQTVWLCIF
ncbi:MAG: histidine kinase, partial [Symploca sp. SIO2B6]|nr:histidine kinase [Symploca sp. SIO2B6]